jgi:hypothetical protein
MLFFLSSCATPEIKLDPSTTDYRNNYSKVVGMENLVVVSRITRIKKQFEGKEVMKVPEFIPEFSKVSLKDDTITLYVLVKIINEKKVPYKIYETYNIKRTVSDYPFRLTHKVYDGSLSYNEFQINVPASQDIEKLDIAFELRDINDQVRDIFGQFSVSKSDVEKGGPNRQDKWGGDPRDK